MPRLSLNQTLSKSFGSHFRRLESTMTLRKKPSDRSSVTDMATSSTWAALGAPAVPSDGCHPTLANRTTQHFSCPDHSHCMACHLCHRGDEQPGGRAAWPRPPRPLV